MDEELHDLQSFGYCVVLFDDVSNVELLLCE